MHVGASGPERLPRILWAKLLKYVYDEDLECPRCGTQMEILAFILEPSAIRKILASVGFPADSPPRHPPRDSECDLAA